MDLHKKTVVVTGAFSKISRADAEAKLSALGAIVTGSVSRSTDLVFAGDKAGSKLNKAKTYGVKVLGEEDLMALFTSGGTPAACFASAPDPEASGAELLTWLGTVTWAQLDPARDLPPLRAALLALEAREGVGAAHRLATESLRKQLGEGMRLLHPAGHDVELTSVGLSPDGRHLATGSWVGDDYDAGGWLQVWELATGRCVNRLRRVPGGVGWPDYAGCIQWRPDGRKLGLAFDTNGVGQFDPWGDSAQPEGFAYITDGWSRPPSFCWSPDGQDVYIACWGRDSAFGARVSLSARQAMPRWFASPPAEQGHVEPLREVFWLNSDRIVGWNTHKQLVSLSAQGKFLYVQKAHPPVALRPDGAELAMAPAGLVFYDPSTGQTNGKLPMHVGAGDYLYSPDSQRLVALIFPDNEFGAEPGLQFYRGDQFQYGPDVQLKRRLFSQPDARAFAWSPDSQRGAALGDDDVLHVYQLGEQAMLQCSISTPKARGVLWGQDGLVVWGPEVLYFIDPDTGALRGSFGIAQEAKGERPLELDGDDLGALLPYNPSFPLDAQRWASALTSGEVIGPAEPALLDGQLAYTVENRWAWPWRWGDRTIHPDATSAALAGALPPALARRFKKAPPKKASKARAWPPAVTVTPDDIAELMWSGIVSTHDGYHRPDFTRRLALLQLRLGSPGALARLREVKDPNFLTLGLAEAAVMLADKDPSLAMELLLEAERYHAEASWGNVCARLAALGGAWVRLGDSARGDKRLAEARAILLPETNEGENYAALARALFWAGRPEQGIDTLFESRGYYSSWRTGPAVSAFMATRPSHALLQRFVEAASARDAHNEFEYFFPGFRLLMERGELTQALAWCERFQRLYTREQEAQALLAWAGADRGAALAWLDKRIQGLKSVEILAFWLNKASRIDPAWVLARRALLHSAWERVIPHERANTLGPLGELTVRCPSLGLNLGGPDMPALERLCLAKGRLEALDPTDASWLSELRAGQSALKSLSRMEQHWMQLAAFPWRAGMLDLYGELVEAAREATNEGAYRDIGLEGVSRAQAELGDLAGAYETWRLISKGKRSYRAEPLMQECARRRELAGLADLLKALPADLNGRAQAAERALERLLGLR